MQEWYHVQIRFQKGRYSALAVLSLSALAFTQAAEARNISIFGSASTSVLAGRAYEFTPATSGDIGRHMTFSIANKPAWASFNSHNGSLSGIPAAATAGSYARITISVTDGKSYDSLPPFTLTVTAPKPANHAPTIGGAPLTSIETGQTYNFLPKAQDADGNTLRFSISSKPSWASFDAMTGRLWGVPSSTQAGSYEEIQISVSDGKTTTALPQFAINVAQAAPPLRNVTVSWMPPTLNADGTALTNLSGYKILYGSASGSYTSSIALSDPGMARYMIENLPAGKYFLVMVAVNSDGKQSDPSTEVAVDLT
jgi:Putative Ig domain